MGKFKTIISRTIRYITKGVPVNHTNAKIIELSRNELLKDRVALVTGGTSGIGFAIAKLFVKAGAKVIITGRDNNRIEKAVATLRNETEVDNIFGILLNNLDIKRFPDTINSAISLFGRIDILVNNAGVLTYDTISSENEEQYDKVLNTNLRGPFFLSQHIGQHMIDNHIKGNILNIGSSSCLRPAVSAYTVSKWGIRGLTLGLARTLAPYGITVNGIAPGQTLTAMVHNHDTIGNLYRSNIPLGRFILPDEIGNMAVILVSEMGRSVIGDIVYMTGGAGVITYEDMAYKF